MNAVKYYVLRLRNALFPPRTNAERRDRQLGKGKYSYISEKRQDDLQKARRRRESRFKH